MNPCKRMTVTAVALSEDMHYLGRARNGNEGECTEEEGRCGCVHSEERILDSMPDKQDVAHIMLSHSPCLRCAKLMQIGFPRLRKVWYKEAYRKTDGIEYLRRMGIEVRRIHDGL